MTLTRQSALGKPIDLVAYYDEYAANGWYQTSEPETERWMAEHILPDWRCVDLGCHIGWYTMLMSLAAPQGHVLALDACGRSLDMLRKNLAHNAKRYGYDFGNVSIVEAAVGTRPGRREETLWLTGTGPHQGKTRRRFVFTTLDSMDGLQRIDLIKIDVDGWDYDALLGGIRTLRRERPIVIAEVNHALGWRGRSPSEVDRFLRRMCYDHQVLDESNPNNWLAMPRVPA